MAELNEMSCGQSKGVFFIYVTDRCNFNCSFCSRREEAVADISNEKDDLILKHIRDNDYDNYSILGGEPFLKLGFLKEIIRIIPLGKGKRITTNGSFLNDEIVEWVNENKITISLSINGVNGGEKSFSDLKKISSEGESLLKIINGINSLSIKKVVLKGDSKEDILLSVCALHESFPNAKIEAVFDNWDLATLDLKDIFKFEFVLACLHNSDSSFSKWFDFHSPDYSEFCKNCNPTSMTPEGVVFGCSCVRERKLLEKESVPYRKISDSQKSLFNKIKRAFYGNHKI
jgi:organic radical activating enzyme